jgi:hypothetical protein
MAKYSGQAALTLRLIAAKGRALTYTRQGAPLDPVTQAGPDSAVTYVAKTLALPLSAGKAAHMFGAGNIQKARLDLHIALHGVSVSPKAGDCFVWGQRAYALLADPEFLDPAGEGAFYAHAYAEAA